MSNEGQDRKQPTIVCAIESMSTVSSSSFSFLWSAVPSGSVCILYECSDVRVGVLTLHSLLIKTKNRTCVLVIVWRNAVFLRCIWRRQNRSLMSSVHKSRLVRIKGLDWNIANIFYFPLVYWERAGSTRNLFNNAEKNSYFHSWGRY